MKVMQRKRQLSGQANESLIEVEASHANEVAAMEAEASAPVGGEHQWLELAIDLRKHNMLTYFEAAIAAGQDEKIDIHRVEKTMGDLLRVAYQARTALRDSLLSQLTEGTDSASSRWREVHSTRMSMLIDKHKEDRGLLQKADNDLEQFDPQLRNIEMEFQRNVRAAGFSDALIVALVPPSDLSARVQAVRAAVSSAGIDLDDVVLRLEEAVQEFQDEGHGEAQTQTVESVLKKVQLLAKVLREDRFDELADVVSLCGLGTEEEEVLSALPDVGGERPALTRRKREPDGPRRGGSPQEGPRLTENNGSHARRPGHRMAAGDSRSRSRFALSQRGQQQPRAGNVGHARQNRTPAFERDARPWHSSDRSAGPRPRFRLKDYPDVRDKLKDPDVRDAPSSLGRRAW